ncbi:3'-5' exonuclease [Paenibacillus sp. N4]|uniref:3'-5' exonuclease n=1 Tax=Paenibacillus vietnamensis TaxID=2590547 RepID=UPI001CD06652|nr:3'-5' exonuclease [Paenibacillus vietnamensis]MCA0754868.1 3'-5' exonuclease [Paenibacillus vietnamensis]
MLNDICVFDFETSGLDPAKERVIEMAAIRVVNGQTVAGFSTFVQFEGDLAPKITELTGITPDMLVGGLPEKTAFLCLRHIMGPSSLLVAHNAAFDLQFLHHAMFRLAGKTFSNPFIDTLTIARDRTTYPHRLDNMCEKYGIKLEGAHRALNDVEGTLAVLQAMHAELPVDDWVNKLGYMKKYGPPAWAPAHADLIPMTLKYEERKAI